MDIQRRKVGVVGMGNVGVAAAYALFHRRLATDIVLLDKDHRRAEGEAMDLMHGQALVGRVPVSVRLQGEYGIGGICLSIPCVIGSGGVEGRILPDLTPEELAGLRRSAAVLRERLEGAQLPPAAAR